MSYPCLSLCSLFLMMSISLSLASRAVEKPEDHKGDLMFSGAEMRPEDMNSHTRGGCVTVFSPTLLHPCVNTETSAKLLCVCVCLFARYHASAACRDSQSPGKVPAAPQLGRSGKDPKPTLSLDV